MILEQFRKPKRFFNVNKQEDVQAFKKFMEKTAWGPDGCPFILQEPFLSVPDMVKDMLLRKYLGV